MLCGPINMLDAKHAAKGYLGCFLISVQKYGAIMQGYAVYMSKET
jgi:hypothetical protein